MSVNRTRTLGLSRNLESRNLYKNALIANAGLF
jgi:hypothetical protein